ncbi:Acyl carrier protein, partial [Frankliniella fusca]
MSSRPEWDAFLLETGGGPGGPEDAPAWTWEVRPAWPALPPAAAVLAVVTVLAPVAVWLALTYLRHRAEASLRTMRRFLASAKDRMSEVQFDPRFRQCLRALRHNDKKFAELLRACDRVPGQRPCRRACRQTLGCGSGDDVAADSASDLTLLLSDEEPAEAEVGAEESSAAAGLGEARRRIAEEQGSWYAQAGHGLCLQGVEDSSDDDLLQQQQQQRAAARDEHLWRQLYAEERRRRRP